MFITQRKQQQVSVPLYLLTSVLLSVLFDDDVSDIVMKTVE
jgi:hypothetical protein